MGLGVIEPWHLVLILIIALVIFGPGKLGDVGGALGRGIREFKSSMTLEEGKENEAEAKKADTAAIKKEASEKAS
jgi:sec-independent protein translocase protein TatA